MVEQVSQKLLTLSKSKNEKQKVEQKVWKIHEIHDFSINAQKRDKKYNNNNKGRIKWRDSSMLSCLKKALSFYKTRETHESQKYMDKLYKNLWINLLKIANSSFSIHHINFHSNKRTCISFRNDDQKRYFHSIFRTKRPFQRLSHVLSTAFTISCSSTHILSTFDEKRAHWHNRQADFVCGVCVCLSILYMLHS